MWLEMYQTLTKNISLFESFALPNMKHERLDCTVLFHLHCFLFFPAIKVCRCRKEYKAIRVALIADVKVIEPRPYCPKQEIL